MRLFKRILKIFGIVLGVGVLGLGLFVTVQASAFNTSMAKVYEVPPPAIARSADPAVIARGQHLAESFVGCALPDCHGGKLDGGNSIQLGPLGTMTGPNLTSASMGAGYSDGQLARLIRHGIKKDGRSVVFMPSHHINWLPDDDVRALISYVRSMPASDKANGPIEVGLMLKVMDRMDMMEGDVARRIDHDQIVLAGPPEPTAKYGKFLMRQCTGCHGNTLSGGKLPGTPPSIPIPKNITPDASGLKDWTYADFKKALETGIAKNGKPIDKFMPVEGLGKMNEIEKQALWAALQAVAPRPFGER